MYLKLVFRILGSLTLVVLLAACTSKQVACPNDAHRFWTTFRAAVLKNDLNAIADKTEFPLMVVRFGDAQKKYLSRAEFIQYFPQLLNVPLSKRNPPLTPPPVPATMKGLVRVVITPDGPSCEENPGLLAVGHWHLYLRSEGWRLGYVGVPEFPSAMNIPPQQP